jgi:hypothetical protein
LSLAISVTGVLVNVDADAVVDAAIDTVAAVDADADAGVAAIR